MSLGELAGYASLAAIALWCILGAVCTRRDLRVPPRASPDPSWSGDRHGKGRAYDKGELVKGVVTKA